MCILVLQIHSASKLDIEELWRSWPRKDGRGIIVWIQANGSTIPSTLFNFLRYNLQANDSGLASYVAGQIDRTLSWKVREYNKP